MSAVGPAAPDCVIIGGGGHARMLIDAIQAAGFGGRLAVLDPDASRWGTCMMGVLIMGGDDLLPSLAARGTEFFVIGIGAVADNAPRARAFESALGHGLRPLTVVHPSAIVSPHARIGPGCQLLPGAIVNAGAVLGSNTIVNTGAIVEHDCVIADHVHVATGARLAGTVHVAHGAHIGAGAVVRQSVRIGERAIVAAGAVVVKDVAEGIIVAGVPAAPLRACGHKGVLRDA